jgi:light-regulated signal transduction histidine kinase (bacteriophytochrome)
VDIALCIRAANRAFYETFQLAPEVTLGQYLFDLGNGQWNIPRLREFLEEIIPKNGSLFDFEVAHDFQDIGRRIMLINARQVFSKGGEPKGICVSIQDVSEVRRARETMQRINVELEERVQRRTRELEAANRELEAFSYSVSHDLRSPLRALEGYARILLEEHAPAFEPEAQEYVRDIRRNATKMGQLIDDLLAFSQLSRKSIEMRTVTPVSIIRHILNEFRAEQEARQIAVVVGDLPPCHADFALLKQVWINLLSNAFKYTRKRASPRIEIGSHEQTGELVYFVRDNGAGFDMTYADKLFGVFQRLHKAADFEGTGVGLAIVQRIVHRHGGRVWAEAVVNQGATFYFTLPQHGEKVG